MADHDVFQIAIENSQTRERNVAATDLTSQTFIGYLPTLIPAASSTSGIIRNYLSADASTVVSVCLSANADPNLNFGFVSYTGVSQLSNQTLATKRTPHDIIVVPSLGVSPNIPGTIIASTIGPDDTVYLLLTESTNSYELASVTTDGQVLAVPVAIPNGSLDTPLDVQVGPDGNLYESTTRGSIVSLSESTLQPIISIPYPSPTPQSNYFIDGSGGFVVSSTAAYQFGSMYTEHGLSPATQQQGILITPLGGGAPSFTAAASPILLGVLTHPRISTNGQTVYSSDNAHIQSLNLGAGTVQSAALPTSYGQVTTDFVESRDGSLLTVSTSGLPSYALSFDSKTLQMESAIPDPSFEPDTSNPVSN